MERTKLSRTVEATGTESVQRQYHRAARSLWLGRLNSYCSYSIVAAVSTVQEIEAAIAKLSPGEFLALVDRLRERHPEAWDRQIEQDATSGRLDALHSRLTAENKGKPTRPLEEIFD